MTVRAILSLKGRDCVTIAPDATLAEAARVLSEHHIGAVVITGPDRTIAGILSERDIVGEAALHGAAALDQPVGAVMTREVVTCTIDVPIADLMQQMTSGRFRHLPVVEDGRLAGIISIGDVVKHRLAEMERESEALRQYIATA